MAETTKKTTKTTAAEPKKTTKTTAAASTKKATTTTKATAEKKTTAKAAATKTTKTTTTTKATAEKKTTAKAPKVEKVEEVKVEVKPVAAEVKKAPAKKQVKVPMLQIKLVKSKSGRLANQIKTLTALGLNKINQTVIQPDNAATRGKIFVVKHLVEVTEVK